MDHTEIPLFPLRSVLCPGVALPLHIFEARYRLMIARCIEREEAFGVVLVRKGRGVGPLTGGIAAVGTTAAIRRAGRYPDGRLDILTVGEQRFRVDEVDSASEPYMLARVRLLDEPIGPEQEVRRNAERVGRRFIDYLQLLQPSGAADGPEIEIEFEIEFEMEVDDEDGYATAAESAATQRIDDKDRTQPIEGSEPLIEEMDAAELTAEQRRELLMAAARRLTATDDPTALSYVLTALIQVDLSARQDLLEAPDTLSRLVQLDGLLQRETFFLKQGLRPIIIDPGQATKRSS